MRPRLLLLAAAGVLAFAATARPGEPTFKETLADVRRDAALHKKQMGEVEKDPRIHPMAVLAAHGDLEKRLKRHASAYFVSKECGLYVERKASAAAAWTLEEPPELMRSDPYAERAREAELTATLAGGGVVVSVDSFAHASIGRATGPGYETYPYSGIDRTVDCRDVKAMLQAHLDQWKKGRVEASGEVAPVKKAAGAAKWTAALTAKTAADAAPERREWYAWEGEPFSCLKTGATFVATATYTGAAVTDAKAPHQVKEFLGVLRPVLE